MEVGHVLLDEDPASPSQKGHKPQFSAHVCCGQTAGWIKIPLGTEVGLGPGEIVLDGDPAPLQKRGTAAPILFGSCLLWPTAVWIKMPLGTEIGLGPCQIVLDGNRALP